MIHFSSRDYSSESRSDHRSINTCDKCWRWRCASEYSDALNDIIRSYRERQREREEYLKGEASLCWRCSQTCLEWAVGGIPYRGRSCTDYPRGISRPSHAHPDKNYFSMPRHSCKELCIVKLPANFSLRWSWYILLVSSPPALRLTIEWAILLFPGWPHVMIFWGGKKGEFYLSRKVQLKSVG